jgi:hypothetical protein
LVLKVSEDFNLHWCVIARKFPQKQLNNRIGFPLAVINRPKLRKKAQHGLAFGEIEYLWTLNPKGISRFPGIDPDLESSGWGGGSEFVGHERSNSVYTDTGVRITIDIDDAGNLVASR